MKVGYIRVSTKEQKLDRQVELMREAGVEQLFEEKVSGKNIKDRPVFLDMMNYVRQGDTVVVTSLDRLGRNYADIKESVEHLRKEKVQLEVLDAPFLTFETGNHTLNIAMSDMFLSLLSYIAENEREKILERQRQGIMEAKKKGVYKGRPATYAEGTSNPQGKLVYEKIIQDAQAGVPKAKIARDLGISRSTVYNVLKDAHGLTSSTSK